MEKPVTTWMKDSSCETIMTVVTILKFGNDTAGRSVDLIQELNDTATKNEEQQQCLLQVIDIMIK